MKYKLSTLYMLAADYSLCVEKFEIDDISSKLQGMCREVFIV